MLVLDRKQDQTIVIGGKITVSILAIQRRRIEVGIAAPDDVGILREKLGRPDGRPHKPHEKVGGMLHLTMGVMEGVFIGEDIFVKILGIERGRVKVGTEAPSDVPINRGEIVTEGRTHKSKERF